jgi:hypothetical protein
MKSIAQHNKEVNQAHKIHSKKLQPYLRQVVNLLEQRPKKGINKIKFEIETINAVWKKYCTRYAATHKDKHPNREAFITSIQMYFKDNKICNDEDFSLIFGTS